MSIHIMGTISFRLNKLLTTRTYDMMLVETILSRNVLQIQNNKKIIKVMLSFQLTDNNIFNSRDTKFEQQILEATNYEGVDLVLNSLTEEKLQASVRCLAEQGRFLEIGKFDILNNSALGASVSFLPV